MKKIIQLLIPCFIIMAMVIPFFRVERDVKIDTFETILAAYINENMTAQDVKILKSSYEIKDEDMESYLSYGPISYINVDEITLIRQSDEKKRSQIYEKAVAHIESQKKSFEGYGVEQTKLLKNAKVMEKGNYVICIVSNNAEDVLNEINSQFK